MLVFWAFKLKWVFTNKWFVKTYKKKIDYIVDIINRNEHLKGGHLLLLLENQLLWLLLSTDPLARPHASLYIQIQNKPPTPRARRLTTNQTTDPAPLPIATPLTDPHSPNTCPGDHLNPTCWKSSSVFTVLHGVKQNGAPVRVRVNKSSKIINVPRKILTEREREREREREGERRGGDKAS